jgi:Fe2+ or Zn2+ uptake regulation protein
MDTELVRIFSEAKLRLTTPRIAIFNTLKESGVPLSTAQIIKLCPEIDKVSVYRTIKLFDTLNIVTIVTHGWKPSYELSPPFHPHHHHIVCDKCGDVIELQSPSIETLIHKLAKQHAFMPTSHHFEIHGVCDKCSLSNNL